ncbi:hypothetical protein U1839_06185 [Sphingomonas sp. RT2P30]
MSGFIRTYSPDGTAIAVDQILRIGPEKATSERRHAVCSTTTRDGKGYGLHPTEVDELMRRPLQLIPALPGINLVNIDTHPTDGVYGATYRYPVIAWALCMDGEIRVVTPNGVNDGASDDRENGFHVEMPDGSIHSVGSYSEPSFATDIAELERELRKPRWADGSEA